MHRAIIDITSQRSSPGRSTFYINREAPLQICNGSLPAYHTSIKHQGHNHGLSCSITKKQLHEPSSAAARESKKGRHHMHQEREFTQLTRNEKTEAAKFTSRRLKITNNNIPKHNYKRGPSEILPLTKHFKPNTTE